jgi:glycosyltransferase involved in cell wall biosynthesis
MIKKMSIIILTHNALEYTKKCLDSIVANTIAPFELIVWDNASTDGSVEYLSQNRRIDKLIVVEENCGVAKARNECVAMAEGEVIIFLDNDVEVGKGWDLSIIQNLAKRDVGIVGKTGVDIHSLRPVKFRKPETDVVDVVSGFCFAFRADLVNTIGNIWTDFPFPRFWHEDLEYCLRAKQAGYKVVCDPKINLVHHEHKSMGDNKDAIMTKENQEGFEENAEYILKRFMDKNVFKFYRNYNPNGNDAFDRILRSILKELRNKGYVAVVSDAIVSGVKSFDLCNAFHFLHNGEMAVLLFQENSVYPKTWDKVLDSVDKIFMGSDFLKIPFKESRHKHKLVNVNLVGIDENIYTKGEPKTKDDVFRFLMVGASQPRKNTENLLKTYAKTFKASDKVELIIKDAGYAGIFDTVDLIGNLKRDPECPKIVHIVEEFTDEEMVNLYRTVAYKGAYIHPHRAECFGMPLLEAIACGCSVGTTWWGGPAYNLFGISDVDFFDFKLVTSKFHNWSGEPFYDKDENPLWAEVDMKQVREWMLLKYHGKKAETNDATRIRNKFGYETIINNLINYYGC